MIPYKYFFFILPDPPRVDPGWFKVGYRKAKVSEMFYFSLYLVILRNFHVISVDFFVCLSVDLHKFV